MNIDDKLDMILLKLENLENRIEHIEQSTNNMDNHISFVENIYKIIQKPFMRLLNQFDKNKKLL